MTNRVTILQRMWHSCEFANRELNRYPLTDSFVVTIIEQPTIAEYMKTHPALNDPNPIDDVFKPVDFYVLRVPMRTRNIFTYVEAEGHLIDSWVQ